MSDLLEQMIYDNHFIDYMTNFSICSEHEHCYNSFLRFLLDYNNIKEYKWFNYFYNNYYDEYTKAISNHKDLIAFYTLEHFLDDSLTFDSNDIKNYDFY